MKIYLVRHRKYQQKLRDKRRHYDRKSKQLDFFSSGEISSSDDTLILSSPEYRNKKTAQKWIKRETDHDRLPYFSAMMRSFYRFYLYDCLGEMWDEDALVPYPVYCDYIEIAIENLQ